MVSFNKVSLRMIKEGTEHYNSDVIKSARDVVDLINKLEDISNLCEENIYIIGMDTKNRINCYSVVARGAGNTSHVDKKNIFRLLLFSNSTKYIMVHNHPSGDSTPSQSDLELTARLIEASTLIDIQLLDHIIIGGNDYRSILNDCSI